MKKLLQLIVIALVAPAWLYAGGFQLNDHSARAGAMGFAVASGDAADATTIFYNPAGMTQLPKGFSVSAGLSYVMPGSKFTGVTGTATGTTEMKAWNFPVPNFAVVWNSPDNNLAAGVGVFIPFGLGTEWPDNWTGRNLAVRTYLQTLVINPNVAYSLLDKKLTIDVGLVIASGKVELRQKLLNFNPEPQLDLTGTGNATSFNAGLSYLIDDNTRVGVAYRHNIKMDYSGDAKYSNTTGLGALFQDGPGGTSLNLPNDIRFGISHHFSKNLQAELAVDYIGWSSYDTLKINFDKGPGAPTLPYTLANPRMYKDVPTFRLGAEYTMNETTKLRFGAYYETVPVDEKYTQPFLPDNNRIGMSFGVGYKINDKLSVDASYLGVIGLQREVKDSPVNFNGIYNSWANVVAIDLNYSF